MELERLAKKIKTIEEIADKWAEVTPGRSTYYEKYATVAGADWESGAAAAKGAFKSAVTAAGIESRYVGGIKKAGGAKYERKVKAVGVDRFGPGVAAAKDDMREGFAPHRDVIASVVPTLKPRGPRGDPANYDRSKALGMALAKKRLALIAALPAA